MSDEPTPNEKQKGEGTEPSEAQKEAANKLLPTVAMYKAAGYSDDRIRQKVAELYPGSWWAKAIDYAIRSVTDEQVLEAKEDGIKGAMWYALEGKVNGLSDDEIRAQFSGKILFLDEALRRVTPEVVEQEIRRRQKPRSPEQIEEDQLVERLRKQPGFNYLSREERQLAEEIVRMRRKGDKYVKIRYLLGDSWDPAYVRKFNRAWVVTNFVKTEMLLDRQLETSLLRRIKKKRKKRRNEPSEFNKEQERKNRDIAVMLLWESEGKCILCGRQVAEEETGGGSAQQPKLTEHYHAESVCPVCHTRNPPNRLNLDVEFFDGKGRKRWILQTYCAEHRPHLIDRRRISISAQAQFLREKKKREREERRRKQAQEQLRSRWSEDENWEEDEEDEIQRLAEGDE